MNKIYQGESLHIVFKCRDKDGNPADMRGTTVAVLLRDGLGEPVARFSTDPREGLIPARLDGSYVICRLDKTHTSAWSGRHVLEVKVTKGDLVMIDIVKGIKLNPSVIGKETDL